MSGATRAWEASVIDRRRRFEFSIRRQTSRAAVERHSGDARVNPDMAARRNGAMLAMQHVGVVKRSLS
jgi:hypothetical protein